MSSHSRTKGKARKSAASSAKSAKKRAAPSKAKAAAEQPRTAVPDTIHNVAEDQSLGNTPASGLNKHPERDESFTVSRDDIIAAASAAVDTLPGEATLPSKFVEKLLDNVHNGLSVDADRADQCAAHLAASVVTALLPFLASE